MPDLIHELRIKTKKIRSYWVAVRPVVGKECARDGVNRHRSAARLFSDDRDLHVRSQTIEAIRLRARRKGRRALDRVVTDLQGAMKPKEGVRPGGIVAEFMTFMDEDLMAWASASAGADGTSDRLVLTEGIGRTYRKAWTFSREAAVLDTPAGYHRARRWVKYLRYQLEWLVGQGYTGFHLLREDVHTLGRLLGQLHDIHVLQDFISHHSTHIVRPGDFGPVDRLLSREERRLAKEAVRHGKKALKTSPRRMERKLRTASRAGRSGSASASKERLMTAVSENTVGDLA
ncbi:MAG: CHAD domain-containing protein [Rhodothermia bacterium]|nr:CHAD domain-containing protein [Rhodothermia bacterium]